jgi:hypothetical protein
MSGIHDDQDPGANFVIATMSTIGVASAPTEQGPRCATTRHASLRWWRTVPFEA